MDSSSSEGLSIKDQYYPIDISIANSSPNDQTLGTLNSPYLETFPTLSPHLQSLQCNQLPPDRVGYTHNPQLSTLNDYTMVGIQIPMVTAPTSTYPGQLYPSIAIPGAPLKKRCRRRPEDIDRMYKCGYNGCEKAYGTLNHLNSHVTMHAHGSRRTPEDFREIRKERKARMKEKESRQKVQEERDHVLALNDSYHDSALQNEAHLSSDYQIDPQTSNS